MTLREQVASAPWWAKIVAKVILSRLPINASTWQSLGLFRHGAMDDDDYARGVFNSHWKRCGRPDLRGATVLELGPGDSVASAVIAAAHGARCILVDTGAFAAEATEVYHRLAARLRAEGLDPPDLSDADSVAGVLAACGADYLTEGLQSLRRIATGSVTMVFSQAVLEHVRRSEFTETIHELVRVLSPAGLASHRVDLRDHLGGGLDNLRIRSRFWETEFLARSGFYTNRLSFTEMVDVFRMTHGFVEPRIASTWNEPPISRRSMALEFRDRPDDDLLIASFDVVLGHRPA